MTEDNKKVESERKAEAKAEAKKVSLLEQLNALTKLPIRHVEIPSHTVNESIVEFIVTQIYAAMDALKPENPIRQQFYGGPNLDGKKCADNLEDIIIETGLDWVTKRGTFPKRISRAMKVAYGINLDPIVMGKIGTKAAECCDKNKDFFLDFTDDLTWNQGDFGDSGSCYWGGRQYARKLLMDHNCHAMRFWSSQALDHAKDKAYCIRQRYGTGRVWIIPKRTNHGEVLMAFNAYRTDGRPIVHSARILATVLGAFYKNVPLCNKSNTGGIIYINGGHGFALGSQEICEKVEKVDLMINGPWGRCKECGDEICSEDDVCGEGNNSDPEDMLCHSCADGSESNTFHCANCGRSWTTRQSRNDQNYDLQGRIICQSCSDVMHQCPRCNRYSRNELNIAYRVTRHQNTDGTIYFLWTEQNACSHCCRTGNRNYESHTCPECGTIRMYCVTTGYAEGINGQKCHVCQKFRENI